MDLEARLNEVKDNKYKEFQAKLVPNINPDTILGIRTPEMRKIAKELFESNDYNSFMQLYSLSIASIVLALSENDVSLKYPRPALPKPDPGVMTIPAFLSRTSKNSQSSIPSGVLAQTYGAFSPPEACSPARFRPSRMTEAFPR